MKICIPIIEDKGLQSPVSAHFGSAPLFALCDTATGDFRTIDNRNAHHQHGMCQPLAAIGGQGVEAVVVGGIGRGAMMKLQAGGVRVLLGAPTTVAEALAAHEAGTLSEATPDMACAGHGHGPHGPHGPHACGA